MKVPASRLIDAVIGAQHNGELLLTDGSTQALRIRGPADWLASTHAKLVDGFGDVDLDHDPRLRNLVVELTELRWITQAGPLDMSDDGPLSRQRGYLSLFGTDADSLQRRISTATVVLIGAGGIGSIVAENLVAGGVSHLIALDDDEVRLHNLNRQYSYGVDDVGRPKVDVLGERLHRLAPGLAYQGVRRRINEDLDLDVLTGPVDILLLGADEPADIDAIVWRWCVRHGVAMMQAAVGHERGFWGPLLVPNRHCLDCAMRQRDRALSPTDRSIERALVRPTPWSLGATNSIIAAWAAHDLLQFLMTGDCNSMNRRAHLNVAAGRLIYTEAAACACQSSVSVASASHTR